jgi:hypothetical protein
MKRILTLFVLILILLSSCAEDDVIESTCDKDAIISYDFYRTASFDPVRIQSIIQNGDCLEIEYSASGCSGHSWEVALIDQGSVMESSPPQRNVRFSFENQELCEALITKETAFDISTLQVKGTNQVYLNFPELEARVLYTY